MSDIYDKYGNPITMAEFTKLKFESGEDYHRIGSTDIGPYWVSTVWIGLDHSFGRGPPLIFETMVFPKDQRDDPAYHGLTDIDTRRYNTLQEAMDGHVEQCLLVRATLQEEFLDADEAGQDHSAPPEAPEGEDSGGATGPGQPYARRPSC